jgi:hypothetical protein
MPRYWIAIETTALLCAAGVKAPSGRKGSGAAG